MRLHKEIGQYKREANDFFFASKGWEDSHIIHNDIRGAVCECDETRLLAPFVCVCVFVMDFFLFILDQANDYFMRSDSFSFLYADYRK